MRDQLRDYFKKMLSHYRVPESEWSDVLADVDALVLKVHALARPKISAEWKKMRNPKESRDLNSNASTSAKGVNKEP